MRVEYPIVDGMFSIKCFLDAVDDCYAGYKRKCSELYGLNVSLDDVDYVLFHTPYTALVEKAFGYMVCLLWGL